MSKQLNIRLAARCEAAGRPNNEDNFQVVEDLSAGEWQFQSDVVLRLGSKGALLLVCDGMGGMNAGEVASKIAVETVKHRFSNDNLANVVLDNDGSCCDFIRRVIQEADANIKLESRTDEAKRGMGSTIVLAWLLGDKVYVGWCGDSRAYKYNPQHGLVQLSHDHSYVQGLVDSGELSPEMAFNHPKSNIITRSLGDPRGVAQPDVRPFQLEENDVILLCSDGLCGLLRDQEIEPLLAGNLNSMVSCRDALWEAARSAGWHDNVTIALAQVIQSQANPKKDHPNIKHKIWENKYFKFSCIVVAFLLFGFLGYLFSSYCIKKNHSPHNTQNIYEPNTSKIDSLSIQLKAVESEKDTLYHSIRKMGNELNAILGKKLSEKEKKKIMSYEGVGNDSLLMVFENNLKLLYEIKTR